MARAGCAEVERGGPRGHGDCDLRLEKINKEVDITGLRWTLHRMSEQPRTVARLKAVAGM